ncbi:MRN complex-interacting protein [Eurosta solidaginis]|uniref:MRN complex-interacting protein n=1 Tax=Eurosta solidaginis TaxID=178769 RepID=UPI003531250E
MPQELRIVQCIECQIYQVDLVKKAMKWSCKVCNAKQSLRCEHFRGSGPECRKRVQELNKQQEQFDLFDSKLALEFAESSENDFEVVAPQLISQTNSHKICKKIPSSTRSNFMDENDINAQAPDCDQNAKNAPSRSDSFCFHTTTKWERGQSQLFGKRTMRIFEETDDGESIKKASKWDPYL